MPTGTATPQVPIAVVGVGALMPDALDPAGFWRNVVAGRDLMTDVPPSRWLIGDYYDADPAVPDGTYGRRGAFLPEVDFDPMRYGIPPNALPATDTSQLLALMVAEQVLADCVSGPPADRERVSVLIGASALQLMVEVSGRLQRPLWLKGLRDRGLSEADAQAACDAIAANYVPWTEETFPGLLTNVISGRIANRFDLHGTNHTTDAACASSLAAVYTAVAELALGRADLVLTGGVDTMNDITMFTCFSRTPALSLSGDCRPFSDAADGTMLGEGIAMFALKRLADAERDGDHVYAVIRGVGTSSDGRGAAIYAPRPEGQVRALRRAYESAGYGPGSVELVEAHGTGTRAGDAAEFAALREVFAAAGQAGSAWCALGSVKSQIGHTKAAAGAAGLLKAVLAVAHQTLPPTIKVDQPSGALGIDGSPFYLNTQARPWTRAADHPRRASVSSFGFGGTNFHVTLEEYRPPAGSRARPAARFAAAPDLVLLSARSRDELLRRLRQLGSARALSAAASQARQDFRADDDVRLAVTVSSPADLAAKLTAAQMLIDGGAAAAPGIHLATGDAQPGRVGFLFPGQGSQYVGMGADVAMAMPQAQASWDRTASLGLGEVPLHSVVFPAPAFTDAGRLGQEARLTATEWAQPALAAHSMALLSVLSDLKLVPDCVAGHSFGELTALYAAGAVDPATLLRLARRRGELMREAAAEPSAMLAVTASWEQAARAIEQVPGVWLANDNAPRQVVLAGTREALEAAEARLSGPGIGTMWLNAAAAFHSPLVAPAAGPLLDLLRAVDVRAPSVRVYAGADATVYPADRDELRRRLADQLTAPVRFLDVINAMYADGVRTFVEVGPGAVLTGLAGQILGDREHAAVSLDRRGRDGLAVLLDGLGRLAVRGVAMDAAALGGACAATARGDAAAEKDRRRMTVKIDGGNYGRPYPPPDVAVPDAAVPEQTPQEGTLPDPATQEEQPPQRATLDGFAPHGPPQRGVPQERAPANGAAQDGAAQDRAAQDRAAQHGAAPGGARQAAAAPAGAAPGGTPLAGAVPVSSAPGPGPEELALQALQPPTAAGRPPAAARGDDSWLQVIEAAQQQSAEAHAAFQRAMTDSHLAYLRMTQATFAGLLGMATGEPAPVLPELAPGPAPELAPGPAPQLAPASAPQLAPASAPELPRVPVPPMPPTPTSVPLAPDLPPVPAARPAPAGRPEVPVAAPQAAAPAAAPANGNGGPAGPAPLDAERIGSLLLSIVAERTGYPVEMLNVDMDLEADLGIDSIKKVEILSAVREQAGDMPGADQGAFTSLRTLRAIAEKTSELSDAGGATVPATPAAAQAARPSIPATSPAAPVPAAPRATAVATSASPQPGQTRAAAPQPLPAPGEPGELGDRTLSRHTVRAVATPPSGLALPGLYDGPLIITDDGTGVALLLANQLGARGIRAEIVTEVPAGAGRVILLDGLRQISSADDAVAVNQAAFRAARQAASQLQPAAGVFVTVQDTGGDFGLTGYDRDGAGTDPRRAWLGGLAGLARTAALEWPHAAVRAIDCARAGRAPDVIAAAIADELTEGGPAVSVGLRGDGTRITLGLEAAPARPGRAQINGSSVIVATGGARGVTAVATQALARAYRPRLLLLGRRPLTAEPDGLAGAPDEASLIRLLAGRQPGSPAEIAAAARGILAVREMRASLTAIEQAGAAVRYLPADIRDRAALAAALAEVRRSGGPVTGVVHGAGLLADSMIGGKTDEQFTSVFSPKVDGLRALLDVTADDPLDLLCAFSSIAAYAGNPGQSDYAMANEVMNQVLAAERAHRPDCVVRSIVWGPWQGGMVTPLIAERFRRRGVPLIDPADGARAFLAELSTDDARTEVILSAGPMSQEGRTVAGQLTVAAPEYAYLADHQVGGVPVVPVASVLDWFARAARAWRPEASALVLQDLRVLSKITLPRLSSGGHQLVLKGRETTGRDGPVLHLDLYGDGDRPTYRASAGLAPTPRPGPWDAPAGLAPLPQPYDGVTLFHGPRFHALGAAAPGISAAGAEGTVIGMRALGWPESACRMDPAAVDGALQLAVLWAQRAGSGDTLPMAVRESRLYRDGAIDDTARCVVRARQAGEAGAECDVALIDPDGAIRVELLGVQLVRRPG